MIIQNRHLASTAQFTCAAGKRLSNFNQKIMKTLKNIWGVLVLIMMVWACSPTELESVDTNNDTQLTERNVGDDGQDTSEDDTRIVGDEGQDTSEDDTRTVGDDGQDTSEDDTRTVGDEGQDTSEDNTK